MMATSSSVSNNSAMDSVKSGNGQFLANLYPALVESNGHGNDLVMSIFSVSSVLAMAYVGARGNTRSEMKQALSFPGDEEVNAGYQELRNILQSTNDFTLDVANRIYIQEGYPFLDSYINQLATYFQAQPQMVDFSKGEAARSSINNWVKEVTHGKIKDLLPVLDPTTMAVLVNAVYFKGTWDAQFDKSNTRARSFKVSPTETMLVDMMHRTGYYRVSHFKELGCRVLDMPFKGDRLSMLFFLSHQPDDFATMEEKLLSAEVMFNITRGNYLSECEVAIPKFKVETSHKLVEPLKAIGLVDMFDMIKADFSGMTGMRHLHVSDVVQKAFVEVDEEGSTAAAASGLIVVPASSIPPDPIKFVCDRPFLFAIKDNLSGMILFNGRVMRPIAGSGSTSGCDRRFLGPSDKGVVYVLVAIMYALTALRHD